MRSLRLKYRYLDIRREPMQRRLMLRSRMVQAIREVHHANGFVEVETPTLIKSTPEGARDFIVPSRLQPGTVYALPQSPQQLKQLLMVAGIDRYFQIARCYRDEDLRGDRQPEFTQLDLEMSFVDEASVMAFVEAMAIEVSQATVPDARSSRSPFPMLTYEEALERYGSDKPDIRFGMELVDLGSVARGLGRDAIVGLRCLRLGARGRWPGQGDRRARHGRRDSSRDRRADRAREAVRRQGPGPPVARAGRRGQGPHREVPVRRDPARDHRARPRRRRATSPDRRRRAEVPPTSWAGFGSSSAAAGPGRPERAGVRLGPPLPDVPMGRREPPLGRDPQPVQGRPARGRGAARDPVGRPREAVAGRSGRPRPGAPVRPRAQRLGARRRLDPDPPARPARAQLPAPGPHRRGDAREVRGGPRRLRVRRAAAWRDRPRHRSLGGALLASRRTSARSWRSRRRSPARDPMLEAPSLPEPGQYEELGLRFVGLPERASEEG